MKLIFYTHILKAYPGSGHPDSLMREATAEKIDDESDYSKYLCSALHFDFPAPQYCEEVLSQMEKVQNGELQKTGWSGNAFNTDIYSDRVEIDHQQFGGLPDWPVWTCSVAEFKAALEGWKRFLEMPVDASTEVIVDLPEPPPKI